MQFFVPSLSSSSEVLLFEFPYERDSFLQKQQSPNKYWLYYRRQSPLSDRISTFNTNILFIVIATVSSWSRRVYFYFRCCCYRSKLRVWFSADVCPSIDWFFVFNKKMQASDKKIIFLRIIYVALCTVCFDIANIFKSKNQIWITRAHVFLYVNPFHE